MRTWRIQARYQPEKTHNSGPIQVIRHGQAVFILDRMDRKWPEKRTPRNVRKAPGTQVSWGFVKSNEARPFQHRVLPVRVPSVMQILIV